MCSWSRQSEVGTCKVAVQSVRVPQTNDIELVNRTSKNSSRGLCLDHLGARKYSHVEWCYRWLWTTPCISFSVDGKWIAYSRLKQGYISSKAVKLRMIAAGLKHLHDKEVVHGDLTCTNVLISADGRLHLADFDLSMIFSESQNSTFNPCHQGNVRWMAPEILDIPEPGEVVMPTKAADVYSYGCIMLQLFFGNEPYRWLTQVYHIIVARVAGTEPFRQFAGVEDVHKEHSLKCISVRSGGRPVASAIVEFLGVE
ncbi:kinase-like protein [Suillus decipiens]|nr:kinase-like protein [Suillus decipiens]